MSPYGKVSQAAIAAASLLAESYSSEDAKRLSSREIAEKRKLSQAIVAKVLTTLSQVGIVTGSPGPGGGYGFLSGLALLHDGTRPILVTAGLLLAGLLLARLALPRMAALRLPFRAMAFLLG